MAQCKKCNDMRSGIRAIERELTAAYAFDSQSRIYSALKKRDAIQVRLALHIAKSHTK